MPSNHCKLASLLTSYCNRTPCIPIHQTLSLSGGPKPLKNDHALVGTDTLGLYIGIFVYTPAFFHRSGYQDMQISSSKATYLLWSPSLAARSHKAPHGTRHDPPQAVPQVGAVVSQGVDTLLHHILCRGTGTWPVPHMVHGWLSTCGQCMVNR